MNFEGQSRAVIREAQRSMAVSSKRYPNGLVEVPQDEWPAGQPPRVIQVWRSRRFLVQVYAEADGVFRLSICRAQLADNGRWLDGITWDQLQSIKAAVGFARFDAVEVYPADGDVVDVANMRHLWVLPTPLPFAWRQHQGEAVRA